MSTISVRLDDQDTRLIKEYAKAKNITISSLVRDFFRRHAEGN